MVHLKFIMFFKCFQFPKLSPWVDGRSCIFNAGSKIACSIFQLAREAEWGQVAIQTWKSPDIFHYQQIYVSLVFFNDRKLIISCSRVCDDSLWGCDASQEFLHLDSRSIGGKLKEGTQNECFVSVNVLPSSKIFIFGFSRKIPAFPST